MMKMKIRMPSFKLVLVWLACGLLTFVLTALLTLFGPTKPALLMLAAIGSLFLFMLDEERLLQLLAVMVYLVVGQLMYFARINQALWIPYGLCALLFLRVPSAYIRSQLSKAGLGLPLGMAVGCFILALIVSTVVNRPPMLQVLVGGKAYVMDWSVYLLLALFAVPFARLERGFRLLFALVYVQLPFVLYQFFVVAPSRSQRVGVSWDAIVGSFGGDPNGGGASGTMAYMLVLAMVLAISLWRHRQKSLASTALLILCALLCIGLAEVKVVVLLVPIALAVLYRSEFLRRPVRTLAMAMVVLTMGLGLLFTYDQIHNTGKQARDLSGLFDESFGYSLDTNFINAQSGEMSRMAALKFWATQGLAPDTLRGVVGYGPGAARSSSSLAVGEVARKYTFGIDRSVAATLLWEVGLLGLFSFSMILALGAWYALRAAKRSSEPASKATLEACGAGLILCLVMLPYGRDLLEYPALTFTMMCMLGYAAQAESLQWLSARRAARAAPHGAAGATVLAGTP